MTARNLRAYQRGQVLRAQIRALLEAHPPLAQPLQAKDIRARLQCSPLPALRTVRWHVNPIRLHCQRGNVSSAPPAP